MIMRARPLERTAKLFGISGLVLALGSPVASAQQGPINPRSPTISRSVTQEVERGNKSRTSTRTLVANIIGDTLKAPTAAADAAETPFATRCLAQRDSIYKADSTSAVANGRPVRQFNPSFGCYWPFLEVHNQAEAEEFFGPLKVGNAIALTLGDEPGALYTELLSDNLWIASRVGFARIGFSAQVAADADTTKPAVTQFFQGGGNAILYGAMPLFSWLNYYGGRADEKQLIRRLDMYFTGALGADVPKMGSDGIVSAGSGRLGVGAQGHWAAHKNVFRFFAQGNGNWVKGFSDGFYENLLSTPAENKAFFSGSVTVGVDLAELVRAGVRISGSTLDGLGQKPQFTFQMIPK
jgi:hypothetical protein